MKDNQQKSNYEKESDIMTKKDYKDYVLEQLCLLDDITYKSMMGEYLLYYKKVLVGGIYDNRLLIKIVNSNKKYNMEKKIPYDNAKPMYFVNDLDDKKLLKNIIIDTYEDLKNK